MVKLGYVLIIIFISPEGLTVTHDQSLHRSLKACTKKLERIISNLPKDNLVAIDCLKTYPGEDV